MAGRGHAVGFRKVVERGQAEAEISVETLSYPIEDAVSSGKYGMMIGNGDAVDGAAVGDNGSMLGFDDGCCTASPRRIESNTPRVAVDHPFIKRSNGVGRRRMRDAESSFEILRRKPMTTFCLKQFMRLPPLIPRFAVSIHTIGEEAVVGRNE